MNIITIGKDTRNQLNEIVVGRASAYAAMVRGVPPEIDHVEVHFSTPGNEAANAVVCRRVPGGDWKCYANGFYFPNVGTAHYHVTGRTDAGDSAYLGSGTLRVTPSVLNVPQGQEPIVPTTAMAFNPTNGLYYRVVAELNEDGQIVLATEQEGITL